MEEIRLGSRILQPGRQLLADGERVPIGRRALDIISFLAHAHGEIVTKDELIRAVWPDVIVEENALQVHVAALRKALGPEADRLKTIRGVGYQLDVVDDAPDHRIADTDFSSNDDEASLPIATPVRRRRSRIAFAAVSTATAAVLVSMWRPQSEVPHVQVQGLQADGGAQAQLFAGTLQEDIVSMLSQTGVQTTTDSRSKFLPSSDKGVILKGSVVQTAGRLQVRLFLDDVRSGLTLWSGRYERPVASSDLLTDQVTVAATETVHAMLEIGQQKGLKLTPQLTSLYIRGSELTRSPDAFSSGQTRKIFEELVNKAPRMAAGHGLLALAYLGEADRAPAVERAVWRKRALTHIQTAINIDPYASGVAYDARYLLARAETLGQLVKSEDLLIDGLRSAPDFAFLVMRECSLLIEVGRARDALPYCERALALRPFAAPIGHRYARALNMAGHREMAQSAIDRATRFNPDQRRNRALRFEMAALYGAPERAMALLRDPTTTPFNSSEATRAVEQFLQARSEGNRSDLTKTTDALRRATNNQQLDISFAVQALATLGKTDEALSLLRSAKLSDIDPGIRSTFLFEPATAPLRTDPRFWPIAARFGLVEYWTTRNRWPDFCGSEVPLATCKLEAASQI